MAKQRAIKKPIPFRFVLDELEPLTPLVKPMFGCHAVYVGEKIMLFLCDREGLLDPQKVADQQGVWLATTREAYASLAAEFSIARAKPLEELNKSPWLRLPANAPEFEAQALHACALILQRDPRIGRELKQAKPKRKSASKQKGE
ncbi:MAG: hypothetical protein HYR56_07710 [Acidobacteria bacterium]|nr:hypothetical protein [Acidobacteriota bacterium]MBI3427350.1 hypothetical protein [Acidobacteriota bacterium]